MILILEVSDNVRYIRRTGRRNEEKCIFFNKTFINKIKMKKSSFLKAEAKLEKKSVNRYQNVIET